MPLLGYSTVFYLPAKQLISALQQLSYGPHLHHNNNEVKKIEKKKTSVLSWCTVSVITAFELAYP